MTMMTCGTEWWFQERDLTPGWETGGQPDLQEEGRDLARCAPETAYMDEQWRQQEDYEWRYWRVDDPGLDSFD